MPPSGTRPLFSSLLRSFHPSLFCPFFPSLFFISIYFNSHFIVISPVSSRFSFFFHLFSTSIAPLSFPHSSSLFLSFSFSLSQTLSSNLYLSLPLPPLSLDQSAPLCLQKSAALSSTLSFYSISHSLSPPHSLSLSFSIPLSPIPLSYPPLFLSLSSSPSLSVFLSLSAAYVLLC